MNSRPNPDPGNLDDVLIARADERLAHAYAKIVDADEQLTRVSAKLAGVERDSSPRTPMPRVRKPSRGGTTVRGLVGAVLAAGIFVAAYALQSPNGDGVAQWVPHVTPSASPPRAADAAAPTLAAVQVPALDGTASVPAASPPDLTQLVQGMAHDIATLQQGIEQLKASQERMAGYGSSDTPPSGACAV